MNLHHFKNNGKDSFLEKLKGWLYNKNLDNSSSFPDEELKFFAAPKAPKNNFIELLDRAGRVHSHDFSKNNICIIGDNLEVIEKFSRQLLLKLEDIPSSHESIQSKHISLKQLKGTDTRFLVKLSGLVSSSLLDSAIKFSGTICILPLKSAKIISPLAGTVSLNHFSQKIVEALSGDRELRKLLIASLGKEEFLLIENTCFYPSGEKGSVRCFKTDYKQSQKRMPK